MADARRQRISNGVSKRGGDKGESNHVLAFLAVRWLSMGISRIRVNFCCPARSGKMLSGFLGADPPMPP
jgi:hypothetical protein